MVMTTGGAKMAIQRSFAIRINFFVEYPEIGGTANLAVFHG